MPETAQETEVPGYAHSPSQLHTGAGYADGNSTALCDTYQANCLCMTLLLQGKSVLCLWRSSNLLACLMMTVQTSHLMTAF